MCVNSRFTRLKLFLRLGSYMCFAEVTENGKRLYRRNRGEVSTESSRKDLPHQTHWSSIGIIMSRFTGLMEGLGRVLWFTKV